MKKKIIMILLLMLVLTGCAKRQEDWDKLSKGMSVSEVEEIVGKPDYSTTDSNEISTKAYDEFKKIYEFNLILANEDLEEEMSLIDNVYSASESGKNVMLQSYEVKNNNGNKATKEIYFIGGAVEYIFGQSKE